MNNGDAASLNSDWISEGIIGHTLNCCDRLVDGMAQKLCFFLI